MTFRYEGEVRDLFVSDEQKLAEFTASVPTLYENLKEMLSSERK